MFGECCAWGRKPLERALEMRKEQSHDAIVLLRRTEPVRVPCAVI